MKAFIFIISSLFPFLVNAQQVLTLQECYDLAETSYPLSRQTSLLGEKSSAEIRSIEKERLPQVFMNAQATYQSDVIHLPFQLPNAAIEPPNKNQYRATLDVNQLIYNGGSIATRTRMKEVKLQTQQQQVAVNLYSLKTRINQHYFSVLLFQEQRKQQLSKMEILKARLKEVEAGVKYGAVLPATKQSLQAEILKLEQQLSETENSRKKALDNLAALILVSLDNNTTLTKPETALNRESESTRPEIKLFELQQKQLEATKELISKSNYPRVSGFAQAGYGNPGLNMLDNSFQDFYMAGIKLNWNLFDWGKIKEQKQTIDISQEIVSTERETFLLNNNIQLKNATADINVYQEMLEKDLEIIDLREQVLQTATSQLQNGTITSSEYVTELNNLYEAKINLELHQTQLSLTMANYNVIKGESK